MTELMSTCQYSFHDISRVELDSTRARVPRFNMPFELGMAIGMSERSGYDHFWYAFEARKYRALKSLSDLTGTEVYVHDCKATGVFRCLTNALHEVSIGQRYWICRRLIAMSKKPLRRSNAIWRPIRFMTHGLFRF